MTTHTKRLDALIAKAEQEAKERSPQDLAMQSAWIAGRVIGLARELACLLDEQEPCADEIAVSYMGETWGVTLRESEDDFDRSPELVSITLRGVDVTSVLTYSARDRLYELAMERLEQMQEAA